MQISAKNTILRNLQNERVHVAPRTLEQSGDEVLRSFKHIWALAERWCRLLRPLPVGLLEHWAMCPRGHVVISHIPGAYGPGLLLFGQSRLYNVAYISARDILRDPLASLVPFAQMLDHLLGCSGEESGPYLSQGKGVTPALGLVGRRLIELFALGHGFDELASRDPGSYFARSFALYCLNRRQLSAADPLLYKLLWSTLFSERFWPQLPQGDTTPSRS